MDEAQLLPLRGPIRRILVMRPRALGDLLLATPAFRALKRGFPQAAVHVAVDDTLAPVLRRNPFIDQLWLFPRRKPRAAFAWTRLYWKLWRQDFDLVVDLHGSPRTAVLAFLTGARHRVGYALRGRGRLYNRRIPRDSDRRGRPVRQYAAQVNLDIVARCGVTGSALEDTSLVYIPDPVAEEDVEARVFASTPHPRVGIAPAGTWQAKTFPSESFARVGDLLVEAGCHVALLWGPGEQQIAEKVKHQMRRPAEIVPPTNLETLPAVLARLDLLVSNDSGVKHLAVARGTPTLTLFGPTSPVTWMPPAGPHAWLRLRVPCCECNLTACDHHLCMRLLPPEEVAARALALLGAGKSQADSLSGVELPPMSG